MKLQKCSVSHFHRCVKTRCDRLGLYYPAHEGQRINWTDCKLIGKNAKKIPHLILQNGMCSHLPGSVLGEHRVAKFELLKMCKLSKADCQPGGEAAVVQADRLQQGEDVLAVL